MIQMWFPILVTVATGYLLGNINGAVSVSALKHDDVRSHGSGNAGLTNYFRNFGGKSTFLVLLVDLVKTLLGCAVGSLLLQPYDLSAEGAMLGGFCVSLGHDFPALLGFRGGKGIVCGLAVALAVDWRIAVLIIVVFLLAYCLTKYVSLGSVLAAVSYGIGFCVLHWHEPMVAAMGTAIALMALYMHRGNIKRLLNGTESKVHLKKGKKS